MQKLKWVVVGILCILPIYLMVAPFFSVLIYSLLIYYSARPLYNKVRKVLKNERVSAITSLILIIFSISAFLLYVGGVASIELLKLAQNQDLEFVGAIGNAIAKYSSAASSLTLRQFVEILRGDPSIKVVWTYLVELLSGMVNILLRLFVVFILTYVFLRHGHEFMNWLKTKVAKKDSELVEKFLSGIDRDLEGVFYGNILTALVVSFHGIVVYTLLNSFSNGLTIPYPVLMAGVCGFASLVPAVGVSVAWIPLAIILIVQAYLGGILYGQLWFIASFAVLSFVFVDFIPSWVIRAKISSKNVDENLMLLSYILGPLAFGVVGILLGPITLVIVVNYFKIVFPKIDLL